MPAALAREASNELRRSCACSMESDAEIAYRERKSARQQVQAAIRAEIRNAGKRKRRAETSSGAGVMLAGGVGTATMSGVGGVGVGGFVFIWGAHWHLLQCRANEF